MSFEEHRARVTQNIRRMITCARKTLRKKQYDLAKVVKISQGHYSKVENSNFELTYSQVSYLFQYSDISMKFIDYGFIALDDEAKIPNVFKKFSKDLQGPSIKISYLSPLLINLTDNHFLKKEKILKSSGLDPIYISNLNFPLDINYFIKFLDFYQELIDEGLDNLANDLVKYKSDILKKILRGNSITNNIKKFVNSKKRLENLFNYTDIEDLPKDIKLSYTIKNSGQLTDKQKKNLYDYNNFILKLFFMIISPKKRFTFFYFVDLERNFAKTRIRVR